LIGLIEFIGFVGLIGFVGFVEFIGFVGFVGINFSGEKFMKRGFAALMKPVYRFDDFMVSCLTKFNCLVKIL
jgi:hypothetical protein